MKNLFFLIVFAFGACTQPAKEKVAAVNELPTLTIKKLSGEKLDIDLQPGRAVLIFFNPDCDHCQRQSEAIQKKLTEFEGYTLYFIAASVPELITAFAEKYKLAGLPNVIFGIASPQDAMRAMGPLGTPSIFIYSKEKKLVKRFDSETDVEEILKYLDSK